MGLLSDFIEYRKQRKNERLLAQELAKYERYLMDAVANHKPLPLCSPVEPDYMDGNDPLEDIREDLHAGYKRLHKVYIEMARSG